MPRKDAKVLTMPLPEPPPQNAQPPYELRVAFAQLFVSSLNQRSFPLVVDDDDRELERNIAAGGLLQNLNVRPTPDGRYEVCAGGRRLRALGRLVDAGAWDPAEENIPVRVHPGASDLDLLLLSFAENHHRKGVHFLDDASALANAVRLAREADGGHRRGDGVTAMLAARLGVTQRWVQILCQLDADLHPELKQYFRVHPSLTLDVAKACRVVPADLQLPVLDLFERARTSTPPWAPKPDAVRALLTRDLPTVSQALFDPSKASAGITRLPEPEEPEPPAPPPTITSPDPVRETYLDAVEEDALNDQWEWDEPQYDDENAPRFLDADEFARLQEEAIEQKRLELLGSYPFAEVIRVASLRSWIPGYVRHDGPEAGVLILVSPSLEVDVRPGYVKEEPSPGKDATPHQPANEVQNKHLVLAHHLKTRALQKCVAQSPYLAMRLAIVGILGGSGSVAVCRIGTTQIATDDVALDSSLDPGFALLRGLLEGLVDSTGAPTFDFFSHNNYGREASAVRKLAAASDEDVALMFAALVASRTGTFAGYDPQPGDAEGALALAQILDVKAAAPTIDEAFLKGYRKPHLLRVARACGIEEDLSGDTGKVVRAAILASPGVATFYPPELAFGTSPDIDLSLKTLGAPSKPKGKKKTPRTKQ